MTEATPSSLLGAEDQSSKSDLDGVYIPPVLDIGSLYVSLTQLESINGSLLAHIGSPVDSDRREGYSIKPIKAMIAEIGEDLVEQFSTPYRPQVRKMLGAIADEEQRNNKLLQLQLARLVNWVSATSSREAYVLAHAMNEQKTRLNLFDLQQATERIPKGIEAATVQSQVHHEASAEAKAEKAKIPTGFVASHQITK